MHFRIKGYSLAGACTTRFCEGRTLKCQHYLFVGFPRPIRRAQRVKVHYLLSDTSNQATSFNMFPSSSDCDDYFVYPEDPQSFEQGTELPSKLDLMDGLRLVLSTPHAIK